MDAALHGRSVLVRMLGVLLIVLGLALVPVIVTVATEHRFGDFGRDCGTWVDPDELSNYRPPSTSAGCYDAVHSATRSIAWSIAAFGVLAVAGLSLALRTGLGRRFWVVAVAAVVIVAWSLMPSDLATFLLLLLQVAYAILVVVLLVGEVRSATRRAARSPKADATVEVQEVRH
jgi:hypothetical protein